MLGFETILPFLRPLEPLILDDFVSEIMVQRMAEREDKGLGRAIHAIEPLRRDADHR